MNDTEYLNLARKAKTLYTLTANIQKILLQMFFNEFCDLDELEQQNIDCEEPPF